MSSYAETAFVSVDTISPSTVDTVPLTPSPSVPVLSNNNLSFTLYSFPPPSTRYWSIPAEEYLFVDDTTKESAVPPLING